MFDGSCGIALPITLPFSREYVNLGRTRRIKKNAFQRRNSRKAGGSKKLVEKMGLPSG
jgi:hypothetical protein